ncbi:hypothetical protein LZ575_17170 [Antarcticibacterium sp. 1MA-6-2]|uniref:hypothetical protein n=1 Tax=Antarcticibacterium sp. 1MA-6-2 TaxID=2908210 RepID=UPI001F490701|nr:hypothetical protein [Antarcticibacterium sp. 1MA-6-2]UJH90515.1 hypothetical protein LZ575_17170 [Antarcticibacterium sp. 1MA-6-2]
MKYILAFLLFTIFVPSVFSQHTLKVVDESGNAIPFAILKFSEEQVYFTNLQGEYPLPEDQISKEFTLSYPGYLPKSINVSTYDLFVQVRLTRNVGGSDKKLEQNSANSIVQNAIKHRSKNDPELKLSSFKYKSYNKLFIDKANS